MRERSGNPVAFDGHAPKSSLWSVASMTADRALDPHGNSVYSPACIFEGLRALSLGAAGSTKKELKEIVGDRPLKGDWLGLERRSKWAYGNYAGRVLTGVWLDEAAEPEREFEIACKQNGISVARADLSAPDAGAEISRWISDATDGFITPSVDLDPLALACVSSVLYLKDAWENSFFKRNTERATFHAAVGDIEADYMVDEFRLDAVDDGEAGTFVVLPLSNGASMVLHLPKEGQSLSDVLADQRVFDLVADLRAGEELVELHLPKFSCESSIDNMADVLSATGFSTASNPDLTRMTGLPTVAVSYSHGAKIAIDEDGLEAGAHFVAAACGAAPDFDAVPPTPRVIFFDRPFLYFVVSRTGQPLFIGTVARPEADAFAWIPVTSDEERGTEGGWIIEDEEISEICRITLEEGCPTAPYGITCGVYGLMFHTTWADSYREAMDKYKGMKKDLRECAERLEDDSFDRIGWCDTFVGTWT